MKLFDGVKGLFHRHARGAPEKNVEPHAIKPRTKRDYHKKGLLRLRLERHTIEGIKEYCKNSDITVSSLADVFFTGLLWSKQSKKLKKMLEVEA